MSLLPRNPLRTCRTCRHGEAITRAEFERRLSRHNGGLGRDLDLSKHPIIAQALDAGTRMVWCAPHRLFLESDDGCRMHSLVGLRTAVGGPAGAVLGALAKATVGLVPLRALAGATGADRHLALSPEDVTQAWADARADVLEESQAAGSAAASVNTAIDRARGLSEFDRGLCFACGLGHDPCRSCGTWRGSCGHCLDCGGQVLHDRQANTWRCEHDAACGAKGEGKHPSAPLMWPEPDHLCDSCYEQLFSVDCDVEGCVVPGSGAGGEPNARGVIRPVRHLRIWRCSGSCKRQGPLPHPHMPARWEPPPGGRGRANGKAPAGPPPGDGELSTDPNDGQSFGGSSF